MFMHFKPILFSMAFFLRNVFLAHSSENRRFESSRNILLTKAEEIFKRLSICKLNYCHFKRPTMEFEWDK